MSSLRRKLDALRRRLPPVGTCPEHRVGMPPGSDWRPAFMATLRAFSPYREDRDAYRREQDALAATPPCPRCGWRPEAIYIVTPGDEDGAA